MSCLSCLVFTCVHWFFLKTMKLYKDICSAWRSRTSAEIFFSQIDWCHKRLKNRSTVILQRTLPWIFRKCYFFFHNVFNNHGKVIPVKINYSFVAKNFRHDFEAKCRSFHIVEIRLNSLCFQWICRVKCFIYLFHLFAFAVVL